MQNELISAMHGMFSDTETALESLPADLVSIVDAVRQHLACDAVLAAVHLSYAARRAGHDGANGVDFEAAALGITGADLVTWSAGFYEFS